LSTRYRATTTLDAAGRCVTPGFVDPHTHLPWLGDRAGEFEQRLAGATYMAIMAAGGGIMSTVRRTRAASVAADNRPRLARMLRQGTTSAEAKTGYGLETAAELRQLDAILALNDAQPIELTPTFLPAHAIPAEFGDDTDGYVAYLINDTLPAGAAWMRQRGLTLFCDVFCEEGVFDLAQTRRILEEAAALGYRLKVHADEFVGLGGTRLAVELGAVSADHLWPSGCRARRSAWLTATTPRPKPFWPPAARWPWPPTATPARAGANRCRWSSPWPAATWA